MAPEREQLLGQADEALMSGNRQEVEAVLQAMKQELQETIYETAEMSALIVAFLDGFLEDFHNILPESYVETVNVAREFHAEAEKYFSDLAGYEDQVESEDLDFFMQYGERLTETFAILNADMGIDGMPSIGPEDVFGLEADPST